MNSILALLFQSNQKDIDGTFKYIRKLMTAYQLLFIYDEKDYAINIKPNVCSVHVYTRDKNVDAICYIFIILCECVFFSAFSMLSNQC